MNVRTRYWICPTILAVSLSTVAPATLADEASWNWKWSDGVVVDSPDKTFKLKIIGRLQADYTEADTDASLTPVEGGTEIRRGRLTFTGTFYERLQIRLMYDFASDGSEIKETFIALKNDWGMVRLGHFKEAYGLEELTSSKYITFLERPLPNQAFNPVRNLGIEANGSCGDKFNWALGMFYDSNGFRSVSEDDVSIAGRLVFRPVYEDGGARMVHIGVAAIHQDREKSIRFRARPEANMSGRFVDTGSFAADTALVYALELASVQGPFWFSGEYMAADVDTPSGSDPSFDGYYLQAGYFLTGDYRAYRTSGGVFARQKPKETFLKDGGRGAWEVAGRFSSVDLNDGSIVGGEQENWTLGLNWYPNSETRWMLNWVKADVANGGNADIFLMRWQIEF